MSISPQRRYVLLPQDREIMALTGMDEKEYRAFCKACQDYSQIRPGSPVALGFWATVAIQLAIGALFTGISYLLAPKPEQETATGVDESTIEGQDIIRRDKFTPKSGFDSIQNVVDMGSIIPIIYAKRENGYGGLRVNTNLLWSQLLSVGGGQFFKGLFLVSEGAEGLKLDLEQTALGNNTLSAYQLGQSDAGRISIYYKAEGGRIDQQDYEVGVRPENDPGAIAGNLNDIYAVLGRDDFCQAVLPSNQREFGCYASIGNNLGYKIGEAWNPLTQWQQRNDQTFERQASNEKVARREKESYTFTTRAGFVGTEGLTSVRKGETLTYKIFRTSEDAEFTEDGSSSGGEQPSELKADDVANTIASRQRTFDERINIGDLYKVGSAIAICTKRTPEPFISDLDFDGDGVDVTAEFEVVEPGEVHLWSEARLAPIYDEDARYQSKNESPDFVGGMGPDSQMGVIGSAYSHAFRLSVGALCIERPSRTIEIGFRSNLSVKSSGIAAFSGLITREFKAGDKYPSGSYQAYVDAEFCGGMSGSDNDTNDSTYRKDIQPGKYTASDTRYSFFRISIRDISRNEFVPLKNLYGVRSATGVNVYNYLRFKFNSNVRREMRFMPITAWEIRSGKATGDLYVMDPHVEETFSVLDSDIAVEGNGVKVERTHAEFLIKSFCNPNVFTGGVTGFGEFEPGSGYDQPRNGDTWRHLELEKDNGDDTGEGYVFADVTVEGGAVTAVTYPGTAPQGQNYEVGTWLKLRKAGSIGGSGFRVQVGSVSGDYVTKLGVSEHDDPEYHCYVDGWARLAENFIYDSVQSSSDGQPEHSIAYVNVITENDQTPSYRDCSVLGLNIRSSRELNTLDQLSVYCERGVIDSHRFPDVLYDLFTNDRYGTGEVFNDKQIDKKSFDAAAVWTANRRYYFDGAISSKINLRSWGADRARDFLLDLGVSGGKFMLKPALTFDGDEPAPEPIAAMFTSGNILDESFNLSYLDTQERQEPIVSVKWRQERYQRGFANERGLFPQIRELTVRRQSTPLSAPVIQIDLSSFATTQRHAIDRAKFECLQRKYVNHVVSFKTLPSEATLQVGSIIKIGLETLRYEQPKNGAVMKNGTVVSWPPMSDGTYDVILWNGGAVVEEELVIKNGRSAARGAVFCLADKETKAQAYKIQSVGFDQDGNVDIEAIYWPVDGQDKSLLASSFGDNEFVISGRISD